MSDINDLIKLFKASQPIVWIDTSEEDRVIREIIESPIVGLDEVESGKGGRKVEQINQWKKVFIWSCTQGLAAVEPLNYQGFSSVKCSNQQTSNPVVALNDFENVNIDQSKACILIMRDLHKMFSVPMPARKLRDMYTHLTKNSKFIYIVGPSNEIPPELEKAVYYISYDLPTKELLSTIVTDIVDHIKSKSEDEKKLSKDEQKSDLSSYKVDYNEDDINKIVRAGQGMVKDEFLNAISLSLENSTNRGIDSHIIGVEKRNAIKRSNLLEIWDKHEPFDDVCGNDELKKWLRLRGDVIKKGTNDFGLRLPKGILMVGVPGCGKSMLCKATASAWGIPLIRLDMGKIFAGIVGSSERNMREVIKIVDSQAPCVLWIDEIDKGASGMKSSDVSDAGTTSRTIGTLMQWMTDKNSMVFVQATANDVRNLPAPLLRKGRFDVIWFVGLPTEKERADIFSVQLKRTGRDPGKFDIKKLAKMQYEMSGSSYNYSGSEIEEAINDALYLAKGNNPDAVRNSKTDVTTEDIITCMKNSIPISCTSKSDIDSMMNWGKKHARFASSLMEDDLKTSQKKIKGKKIESVVTAADLI